MGHDCLMIAIAVGAKGAVLLTVAPAAVLLNCVTPAVAVIVAGT